MVRIAFLLAFFGLFGTAALIYYVRYQPDPAAYPVQGIDVSHHQGPIRWPEVAKGGIAFAYIKATEGTDFKDRRFVENWVSSAKSGVGRGAYHFFTLCRPGSEQARNFIVTVPKDATALPPAIDLEFGGNCKVRPEIADVKTSLTAFVAQLQAAYKKAPVFYVTHEFYVAYRDALPDHANLWVRSIAWRPSFGGSAWTFWQYHNRGSLEGIDGPVDRNVFNGTAAEFRIFTNSEVSAISNISH